VLPGAEVDVSGEALGVDNEGIRVFQQDADTLAKCWRWSGVCTAPHIDGRRARGP
jgi:hypothetical protein